MQSPQTVSGISYSVPDQAAVASHYEKFGFVTVVSKPDNFILSDGSLLISLSKSKDLSQQLCYFAEDAGAAASELEASGMQVKQEGDRYIIMTPDGPYVEVRPSAGVQQPTGRNLMTLGNEIMNPAAYPNKDCGAFGEWAIPVKDIEKSLEFWEKLGFKASSKQTAPYPHIILSDGNMLIGLHQTTQFSQPCLTYFAPDMKDRIEKLRAKGIRYISEIAGTGNVMASIPEGPKLLLFSF